MSLPYPRCGEHEIHPAHHEDAARPCPGWTAEQKTVRDLVTGVRECVRENYGPGEPLPGGLRVEMHPSVYQMLMTDPDVWDEPDRAPVVTDFFPVLVRVTTDVKRGAWRLVIVAEEVLLEG